MDDKNLKRKKIQINILIFVISMLIYGILSVFSIGFITFGTTFMVVIQPIIVILLFLYYEEQFSKKKLKKYTTVKNFYLLSVVIPFVISIVIFMICKFIAKDVLISAFGNMIFAHCGMMTIFLAIKLLIKLILKKMHKIE